MMELRSVISRTVQKYDIFLSEAEKFDEKTFFDGVKDHFTAGVLRCGVIFKKRLPAVYEYKTSFESSPSNL